MKKIIFLFLLALTIFSCSTSNENNTSSDLLQKVVFFPEKQNETSWYFNAKGLLYEIKNVNGELIEEFSYDSKNNVIKSIKHTDDETHTYNVSYNSDNIITAINGTTYNYDSVAKRYYYTNATNYLNCEVNDDMLALNFTSGNMSEEDAFDNHYEMTYENSNMLSFQKSVNGKIKIKRNFGYDIVETFNDNGNPLRKATLSVLKLKSLIDPEFFIEGISSQSLIKSLNFGTESALNYNYGILTYPNNHIEQQGIEVFSEDDFVEFYVFTQYYYQGQNLNN